MRIVPRAAPVPRVVRSRRDDRYQAGRPPPPKRAESGYVISVQDDLDTVTVDILDEQLTGVIPLGEMPPVGAIVEVESRGNLLVIPVWYVGPTPPLYFHYEEHFDGGPLGDSVLGDSQLVRSAPTPSSPDAGIPPIFVAGPGSAQAVTAESPPGWIADPGPDTYADSRITLAFDYSPAYPAGTAATGITLSFDFRLSMDAAHAFYDAPAEPPGQQPAIFAAVDSVCTVYPSGTAEPQMISIKHGSISTLGVINFTDWFHVELVVTPDEECTVTLSTLSGSVLGVRNVFGVTAEQVRTGYWTTQQSGGDGADGDLRIANIVIDITVPG